VLRGFTIRNGVAVFGAGIACDGASPRIEGSTIRDNTASSYGGGIYCHGSLEITDNPIIYNFAKTYEHNAATNGGGIYCQGTDSAPVIEGNRIVGNSAQSSYWAYGGGIYVGSNTVPTIRSNFSIILRALSIDPLM